MHDRGLDGVQHTRCNYRQQGTRLSLQCAVGSRPMMILLFSWDREQRRERSIWKPSLSFVNLNGIMSSSPSEDRADAKWLSLIMSMPT